MRVRNRFDLKKELEKTNRARRKSMFIMAINIALVFVVVLIMSPSHAKFVGIRFFFSSILFIVGVGVILFFVLKWYLSKRKDT
ncbi:MAG: hypothetical protein J7L41_08100 [Synergistetes bacterium]|nr:hypothetical protein [Synergistota bacterium]